MKLPEITKVLDSIKNVNSKVNSKVDTIDNWINHQRNRIEENRKLISQNSEEAKIGIFKKLIIDFLMRAVKGERGNNLCESIEKHINSFEDLNEENFLRTVVEGRYRWGADTGTFILREVVNTIENEYDWEWNQYFKEANAKFRTNFEDDPFLKIKYVGYKVRDLAVSNFNDRYVANDLHVVRVATRIGLLNHGFHLLSNEKYEMGNNPSDESNYLFLHQLFQYLSSETNDNYSPVDIDRAFWHLGRSICRKKPKCGKCPLNRICLTGKERIKNEYAT